LVSVVSVVSLVSLVSLALRSQLVARAGSCRIWRPIGAATLHDPARTGISLCSAGSTWIAHTTRRATRNPPARGLRGV